MKQSFLILVASLIASPAFADERKLECTFSQHYPAPNVTLSASVVGTGSCLEHWQLRDMRLTENGKTVATNSYSLVREQFHRGSNYGRYVWAGMESRSYVPKVTYGFGFTTGCREWIDDIAYRTYLSVTQVDGFGGIRDTIYTEGWCKFVR